MVPSDKKAPAISPVKAPLSMPANLDLDTDPIAVDLTVHANQSEEDEFFPSVISDDEGNEAIGVEIIQEEPTKDPGVNVDVDVSVRQPTRPTPPAGSGPGKGKCLVVEEPTRPFR